MAIARALGLDVELPDPDNLDDEYWARFDWRAWRQSLEGRVDMTAEELVRGDPEWALLKRIGADVEVWFDIEEGIVFRCLVAQSRELTELIRGLAAGNSIPLSKQGQGSVVARQASRVAIFPLAKSCQSSCVQRVFTGTEFGGSSRHDVVAGHSQR